MKSFLLNLLLAAVWAGLTGSPTLPSFAFGFLLGYLVLLLLRPTLGETSYHGKVWRLLAFLVLYAWDFIAASLRVAYDVLTPQFHMKPGVIRVPLEARTDIEIIVLANLLSLTPGSLSLDISRDRSQLYLHAMYIDDGDADRLREEIKDRLERRVLALLRGPEHHHSRQARQETQRAGERRDD